MIKVEKINALTNPFLTKCTECNYDTERIINIQPAIGMGMKIALCKDCVRELVRKLNGTCVECVHYYGEAGCKNDYHCSNDYCSDFESLEE